MIRIGLAQGDVQRAAKFFNAKPAQIKRATRRTVRTITNDLHKELGGTIPREADISVLGYRKVRVKKKTPKGRGKSSTGSVWVGQNQVQARFAKGRKRNDKARGGAWAGKYFFKNAFVLKAKSGFESIFQRTGKGKLPVKQAYINLPKAQEFTRKAADRAKNRLVPLLEKNLRIEMNKRK